MFQLERNAGELRVYFRQNTFEMNASLLEFESCFLNSSTDDWSMSVHFGLHFIFHGVERNLKNEFFSLLIPSACRKYRSGSKKKSNKKRDVGLKKKKESPSRSQRSRGNQIHGLKQSSRGRSRLTQRRRPQKHCKSSHQHKDETSSKRTLSTRHHNR